VCQGFAEAGLCFFSCAFHNIFSCGRSVFPAWKRILEQGWSSLSLLVDFSCKCGTGQLHNASALIVLLLCLRSYLYSCTVCFQLGLNSMTQNKFQNKTKLAVRFGLHPKNTWFSLFLKDHFKNTDSVLICVLSWFLDPT